MIVCICADDILHARIQTMGVAEHIFDVELHGETVSWHLFDVGGARGQRHSWVPFFDDANAIIFLAPISAFDQVRELSIDAPVYITICFSFDAHLVIRLLSILRFLIFLILPIASSSRKIHEPIESMTPCSCLLKYVQMRC